MRRVAVLLTALLIVGAADAGAAPDPVLKPDSAWQQTGWGYVRKDWTPPPDGEQRTVLFEADGYAGAGTPAPSHYIRMRDGELMALVIPSGGAPGQGSAALGLGTPYVHVHQSVRGTGCSSGEFHIFERSQAEDGREMIEWLAHQPWANPKVGLIGHSYSGIMAWLIASTDPPSLGAMVSPGRIGDVYRDAGYPGGILENVGVYFDAVGRMPKELAPMPDELTNDDEICAQNVAARNNTVRATNNGATDIASHPFDDDFYREREVRPYISGIRVPVLQSAGWQDGTTGPRGDFELFQELRPVPVSHHGAMVEPKRLIVANGTHTDVNDTLFAFNRGRAWFDHFLRGIDNDVLDGPPVTVEFGVKLGNGTYTTQASMPLSTWPPAPQDGVSWRRLYLGDAGTAAFDQAPAAGSDTYVSGPSESFNWQTTDNERLLYRSPAVDRPTPIVGPIDVTLYASIMAADADFYVVLADEDPANGELQPLQRGLLRASMRKLDPVLSQSNAAGDLIRPWHPSDALEPVTPGELDRYEIEMFPLAHVLPAGHRLVVMITNPPAQDMGTGNWGYPGANRSPVVVSVARGGTTPSKLLIPTLPWPDGKPLHTIGCGTAHGYTCQQGLAQPASRG